MIRPLADISVDSSLECPLPDSNPVCRRSRQRAFTLVEMLVVVLILAILMAVALPLYLAAEREAARRTARGNLHSLITAEQAYKLKNGDYTDIPSNLFRPPKGVIDALPAGPGDTVYTLHTRNPLPDGRTLQAGGVAACAHGDTAGDFGCFIPGVDTQ